MAKVTDEYVQSAFYRRFAVMSPEQQAGIIEGLRATMAVMAAVPSRGSVEQMELPEAEEGSDAV